MWSNSGLSVSILFGEGWTLKPCCESSYEDNTTPVIIDLAISRGNTHKEDLMLMLWEKGYGQNGEDCKHCILEVFYFVSIPTRLTPRRYLIITSTIIPKSITLSTMTYYKMQSPNVPIKQTPTITNFLIHFINFLFKLLEHSINLKCKKNKELEWSL